MKKAYFFTEKENLCLYGYPGEQWEVNLPAEEVPPELPEPALGINFARDGMQEKDWLSLVAVHSDAWLLSVAFYFGARFGFDKADRYVFLFILFQILVLTLKDQLLFVNKLLGCLIWKYNLLSPPRNLKPCSHLLSHSPSKLLKKKVCLYFHSIFYFILLSCSFIIFVIYIFERSLIGPLIVGFTI